ncbi:triphosphoribosyl-dephospho-CoA synthase [Proteiniborus ethanoligenes]|uniref:Probable 2-(5''-triphosphoribosyl)-3'-dephosphocoenzyme-A synthase n=1 Tax=Proteiniborus ethanoligenes TaxID=415015 RepID=A0A1H3LCC0_9FIRM|nr:triphosphoribosyl-dephospho-CoA synthase CitG [Proteiniborus ethanoligenes]SDY61819.1 triphosphoribosyl-dephospho-CoA synthase [Proteiniborus ethanoligenes]
MSINYGFCEYISEIAIKSMLLEVAATPKPGLVDRNNSGAHKDMDFYTFMESSASQVYTFYNCALEGLKFEGKENKELLNIIRPIGIEGENKMFNATRGINTHKGLIFSLGIIAAAAGLQHKETKKQKMDIDDICHKVKDIAEGIVSRELGKLDNKDSLTYGEILYKNHGIKGIRGEAESGFSTVRYHSLPIFRELMKGEGNLNDNLVQVIFHLMTITEDVNILGRHGVDALEYVKSKAKEVLALGGIFTEKGKKKILEVDKDFIYRNISPGGSADLLAVTLMLYLLENYS